jgi:serine/threonine-protein kinase
MGPYELQEVIDEGAQGIVYKARHTTLGHTIALKTMHVRVPADSDRARRFVREVQAVTRLTHPHIVRVYEYGEQDGQPYYTMAFLPRGNLAQHRDEYRDPRAAAALVEKVARAVQYAHDHQTLHRDLKPGNVLLDEQGEPLVGDFGLAKLRDADAELTHTDAVLGTPAYMAPEQAAARTAEVGPATDVWAMGVILYELVTGRRPFDGSSGSEEIRRRILQDDPPWPRTLRPGLDRSLETIVLKCLAKEPGRRYASAGALADDLGSWLRGEPIAARPEPASRRLRRWLGRHWFGVGLLASLVVAAVSVATVMHFRDPDYPLHRYQRQLARGEAVTLIGESGAPRWSSWALIQGAFRSIRPEQAFAIQCYDPCVLELLRDLPIDRYRFSAEVWHQDGKEGAMVGICVAGSRHGAAYHCCGLSYNDIGSLNGLAADQPNHPAAFAVQVLRPDGDRIGVNHHSFASHLFSPAGPSDQRWRKLCVEVAPERVRALWDGQLIGEVRRTKLEEKLRFVLSDRPDLDTAPAQLNLRGGLGVYLHEGIASFRNVVVEPLGDSE